MISQVVKTRVKIELAVSLWKNVITSLNYLHTACSPLWTAVPLLLLDMVDHLSVHKHLKNFRVPLLSWLASAARWCFSDLSTWVINYCAVLAIVENEKINILSCARCGISERRVDGYASGHLHLRKFFLTVYVSVDNNQHNHTWWSLFVHLLHLYCFNF